MAKTNAHVSAAEQEDMNLTWSENIRIVYLDRYSPCDAHVVHYCHSGSHKQASR